MRREHENLVYMQENIGAYNQSAENVKTDETHMNNKYGE